MLLLRLFLSAVHSSVRISELLALSHSPRPRPHRRRPSAGLCPGQHPQPALPAPKDDEAKGQLHVEGEVLDSPRQRMNAAAPKPRSQEAGNAEPHVDGQAAESQQRSTWQGSHGNAKGVVRNYNSEPARLNGFEEHVLHQSLPPLYPPSFVKAGQLLFLFALHVAPAAAPLPASPLRLHTSDLHDAILAEEDARAGPNPKFVQQPGLGERPSKVQQLIGSQREALEEQDHLYVRDGKPVRVA